MWSSEQPGDAAPKQTRPTGGVSHTLINVINYLVADDDGVVCVCVVLVLGYNLFPV